MKKGDILEGKIEEIRFPNKGYFHYEDTSVSVKNVLPGAEVSVRVKKKRSGHAEAILLETKKESPLASKKPVCPHFYECGGCSYQQVAYTNQLRLKEKMVKTLLSEVVHDLPWEGIEASPDPLQYRNKMEFTFGDEEKDGPLTLGLHRQGSTYDVLGIHSCALVRPAWNEILKFTQSFFRKHRVNFYHKMQRTGILRHLVIRQSFADGGILVNLVTTTRHELTEKKQGDIGEGLRNEVIEELHLPEYVAGLLRLESEGRFETLTSHSHLAGVLYTENDSLADAVVCDSLTKLYGDDYLMEEVLGLRFKISPFSFFQTNTRGCEVLYRKVREYVLSACPDGKAGVIYDLYSGTGTIAQILSPVATRVYGIELVEEAVEAARENAKLNRLKNCEFIAGDVLKKLDEIEEKPDFIVLDPPRDGCTPKALEKILSYGVEHIIYISCKPTSLARDLVTIQERGYRVVRAAATDGYPQTVHVETVALLSRLSEAKHHIEVKVD
ncbi:MAG: class I SAM-dependent RNA methyltransferase [Eubacterium sp.]|nr:class I SAM-dependent RNA methyltransferase [Eubacterium sp.]